MVTREKDADNQHGIYFDMLTSRAPRFGMRHARAVFRVLEICFIS
jgi:hypothetical protein